MFRISMRHAVLVVPALVWIGVLASEQTVAQTPAGGGVTALTSARVIDGTGRPALEQATVVIRQRPHRRRWRHRRGAVPAGVTESTWPGKTIMPGIDQRPRPRAEGARREDSHPRGPDPPASDVRERTA